MRLKKSRLIDFLILVLMNIDLLGPVLFSIIFSITFSIIFSIKCTIICIIFSSCVSVKNHLCLVPKIEIIESISVTRDIDQTSE